MFKWFSTIFSLGAPDYYFIFPSKFPTQNGGSQLNTTLIGEYDG